MDLPKSNLSTAPDATLHLVELALRRIPASISTETRTSLGMSLTDLGDAGVRLWDSWSASNPEPPDAPPSDPSDGVRAFQGPPEALVWHVARRYGWTDPDAGGQGLFGGDPLDIFGGFRPRPIPAEAFPSPFRAYVSDQAELLGSDPSYIGMTALAAAAACIDDAVRLQPKRHDPTWTESARLWVALVGDPSSRKSPAISKAIRHVKRFDREDAQKSQADLAEWREAVESLKAAKTAARKSGAPVPKDPPEPPARRLLVSDATVEALSEVLKDNPRGLLCLQDELSGWFASMDAYKGGSKGASKDRANWLEAYNGGSRLIDRVTRGAVFVPNWSVCMVGGIQPEIMRGIAGSLGHDGLLQRFLVVCGSPAVRDVDRCPDRGATDRYREVFERLRTLEPGAGNVTLCEAAHEVRERVGALARRLGAAVESQHIAAWLGKWDGTFARLLLLWHCVDAVGAGKHPSGSQVSLETAERVEKLLTVHLLHHAVHFFSDVMDGGGRNDQAKALARAILARRMLRFTRRDVVHHWKRARGLSEAELREVVSTLASSAWVSPDPSSVGVDGKPSAWWVNPAVHTLFADIAASEGVRRGEAREELLSVFREARSG